MIRAVFLDRDGTMCKGVRHPEPDQYAPRTVEEFELLPGVTRGIKLLNELGFKVIVVTNQSGIARGYFTEETLNAIHQQMSSNLIKEGAHLDAIYYCPHRTEENCFCRKPRPGMFIRALREFHLNLHKSYMIGDSEIDMRAGRNAGCKTVLVKTGRGRDVREEVCVDYIDHTAPTFLAATYWILTDCNL